MPQDLSRGPAPPVIPCLEPYCGETTRFPRRNGWTRCGAGWVCPDCLRALRCHDPSGWSTP